MVYSAQMVAKRKRENYSFDSTTLSDLRFVQEKCRAVAKNTAVSWCVVFCAKALRAVQAGQVLLSLDPRSGALSALDLPGQDLGKAAEAAGALRRAVGADA